MGIKTSFGGSVTFAQRFGSALNCNPHFHSLLLDGVFNTKNNIFHSVPSLQDADVKEIVETTAHRVIRMLKRRGVLDENEYDDFAQEQPVLAGMTSASIIGLVSIGERAGQRVRSVLQDPAEGVKTGDLCFASRGFSLHAATRIAAGNKQGLENLCNYVARPPLAAGSLQRNSDEELSANNDWTNSSTRPEKYSKLDFSDNGFSFKLKTPWSDGTTHLILSPNELIDHLCTSAVRCTEYTHGTRDVHS